MTTANKTNRTKHLRRKKHHGFVVVACSEFVATIGFARLGREQTLRMGPAKTSGTAVITRYQDLSKVTSFDRSKSLARRDGTQNERHKR